MMRLFNEFPVIKWILVVCGVLYFLDKYLGINPLGKLVDVFFKKVDELITDDDLSDDLNDQQIKQSFTVFQSKDFYAFLQLFNQFNESRRSLAIEYLGKTQAYDVVEEWMKKYPTEVLPQILHASMLIQQAWKVRGRGYIDSVSEADLAKMKMLLGQAKDLLFTLKDKDIDFKVNCHALLLHISRAMDFERSVLHDLFNELQATHFNHVELNFAYFTTISTKWGGTQDELDAYMATLGARSLMVKNLVMAQYYFDMVFVYGNKDTDGKITQFLETSKNQQIDSDELYVAEFYDLMYLVAGTLKQKELKKAYLTLMQPYVELTNS